MLDYCLKRIFWCVQMMIFEITLCLASQCHNYARTRVSVKPSKKTAMQLTGYYMQIHFESCFAFSYCTGFSHLPSLRFCPFLKLCICLKNCTYLFTSLFFGLNSHVHLTNPDTSCLNICLSKREGDADI